MNSDSWTGAREGRLDRAIDRAVRDMMHLDPPTGLRRRVLARLNAPDERRTWSLPTFAFASAALVVLMLSLTLLPRAIRPPVAPTAPGIFVAEIPSAPEPDAFMKSVEGATATVSIPGSPAVTREPIRMPRVSNVFGAPSSSVSATVDRADSRIVRPATTALDGLPPLRIVPLSARPIQIPPIVIDPLTIGRPPR
jgi:hypothetical protein